MSTNIVTIVHHRAKIRLGCEAHWTLGAWARAENGRPCDPLSSCARRWCARGSVAKMAYDLVGNKQAARRTANRMSMSLVPAAGGPPLLNEAPLDAGKT